MKTIKIQSILGVILLTLFFTSCSENNDKKLSTATSGEAKIVADETFESIVGAEEEVFESLYPKASLTISYKPETEMFKDFLNDSCLLIFTTRELNEKELEYFKKIQITTRSSLIAKDGIALIISRNNIDSNITTEQIKDIIKGKLTDWSSISSNSKMGKIIPVFDNKGSSTVRFLCEFAGIEKLQESGMYAFKTNREVIEYVNQTSNAIGIIGVNWISDGDDPKAMSFKNSVRVMAVKNNSGKTGDDEFYQPYQAYIATGQYPLSRSLYTICREPRTGLATGFASFIAGDKGQRIILKSGILPATAPLRIVEIKD